jgi:hypothetical protein
MRLFIEGCIKMRPQSESPEAAFFCWITLRNHSADILRRSDTDMRALLIAAY